MTVPTSVLLIDDSPIFLHVAMQFLREHCTDCVTVVGTAVDGAVALARARELRPQVIVVDLAMSGMSGFETIPRLRESYPDAGIVALTQMELAEYRAAALAAGADEFVTKSTLSTDLLPAIERARQRRLGQTRRGDTT
jgi:DNA-binding NarL/FixJ family response regulator